MGTLGRASVLSLCIDLLCSTSEPVQIFQLCLSGAKNCDLPSPLTSFQLLRRRSYIHVVSTKPISSNIGSNVYRLRYNVISKVVPRLLGLRLITSPGPVLACSYRPNQVWVVLVRLGAKYTQVINKPYDIRPISVLMDLPQRYCG